ncbi:MAG: peptidoglycan DD-metalloendopeptidase family protein [Pseudomonadota bacterium]|nr:peptidoglycan DD-metalloendopeptidase family protein [Pseudomonadota bacterium]
MPATRRKRPIPGTHLPRLPRLAGLPLAVLSAVALVLLLAVQPAPAQELDTRREATRRELAEIEQAIRLTDERRDALSAEIDRLERDRATLNSNLIEASKRARGLEDRIAESGGRLNELRRQQDETRASLLERRELLGEVLAALQRMAVNPPPALLVTPDDALTSVRSAILLGSVVPELRAESRVLLTELRELSRISDDIDAERLKLAGDLMQLAEEEQRLSLLLDEKKKLSASARQELAGQSARAAELAAKAGTLSKLIETLETRIAAAREAAEAARKAEVERRRKESEQLAAARADIEKRDFSDTARIAPAMAFEAAKGLLPRPVAGEEIRAFGEEEPLAGPSQGLYIETRASSRVVSPSDGWVVYAGPFRSYGQLLILNAGNGYHVVLAGMDRIDVQMGQFVLAGEPVAVMGARRVASADAVDMDTLRPVLYVEFRKDGNSIDPTPWWSDSTLKREAHDS